MDHELIINPVTLSVVGGTIALLLGMIAFFLSRILTQFDTLNSTVVQLNGTMLKIDKDLTNEISTLKAVQLHHAEEIRNFGGFYDRMRETENNVTFLQAKCEEFTGAKQR